MMPMLSASTAVARKKNGTVQEKRTGPQLRPTAFDAIIEQNRTVRGNDS
jgi:hypothetical protein